MQRLLFSHGQWLAGALIILLFGCTSEPEVSISRPLPNDGEGYSARRGVRLGTGGHYGTAVSAQVAVPVMAGSSLPRKSPSALYSEVRVRKDYMPRNARGRRDSRSMRPRYITIHSTQNWGRGADAWRHSLALKRGKLGRLSWHYTVDEKVAVQHLPTNVTGNHADYDGPGNRYSIGIEMCEHPGNSRSVTVDRAAKLSAYLMCKYDIPLRRVVPHYHWPRWGRNPPNKNCPHFLLDHGRPGRKWRGFLAKVRRYHDEITKPSAETWASR